MVEIREAQPRYSELMTPHHTDSPLILLLTITQAWTDMTLKWLQSRDLVLMWTIRKLMKKKKKLREKNSQTYMWKSHTSLHQNPKIKNPFKKIILDSFLWSQSLSKMTLRNNKKSQKKKHSLCKTHSKKNPYQRRYNKQHLIKSFKDSSWNATNAKAWEWEEVDVLAGNARVLASSRESTLLLLLRLSKKRLELLFL